MKYIRLYEDFSEEPIINIVNGHDFNIKYLSTESGFLEKCYFTEDADSMGSSLGSGTYYSFTEYSTDHYQSDEYFDSIEYFRLKDDAIIVAIKDSYKYSSNELDNIVIKNKADGIFDIGEATGDDDVPYLGLCIMNKKVIEAI